MSEHKIGDTYRSAHKIGGARLTYQPNWSPSQPWASFINGTAGRHFPTLQAGVSGMAERGYKIVVPK